MARGADYRFQGERGQKLAEFFLLQFFTLARPEPDSGIDAVGHLRKQPVGSPVVCFNFQFKTGKFRPDGKTVEQWISLVDREPVILVHADVISRDLRFLALHTWMVHNPDWPRRVKQGTVTLNLAEFDAVGDEGRTFALAIEEERQRITGEPTLWRTAETLRLPIRELDLFQIFGRLGQIEPPVGVIDEVRSAFVATLDRDVRRFLQTLWSLPSAKRREVRGLPHLSAWLDASIVRVAPKAEARERKEFTKFVYCMEAGDGDDLYLPGFTYDETSCWRVFVLLFPQAVLLLDRASKHPKMLSDDQLMALSQLASTVAASDDPAMSHRGQDILRRLNAYAAASRPANYAQYRVGRQIRYTSAEAGLTIPSEVIDFMSRHPLEWDLRLNREYYKTSSDGAMVRSTLAKIARPRARDVQTLDISAYYLERLPRNLVDVARRKSAFR